jgi:hypothetical protein
MKGPPQVSVRGQRKPARHRPAGSGDPSGRCATQAMRGPGRRGLLPGVVEHMKRHSARLHRSSPSNAIPRYQQGLAAARGSREPMRWPDRRPPVIVRGAWRALTGDRGPSKSGSKRFGAPHLRPPRPERSDHPDRVHDRGRCPLYVRAQLETAGLTWTQRDLAGPGRIARETGKTQLTGYFRRWWQVLGSNQRRLSRRFYSEPIPTHRNSH